VRPQVDHRRIDALTHERPQRHEVGPEQAQEALGRVQAILHNLI
jgi:hypothetical protein